MIVITPSLYAGTHEEAAVRKDTFYAEDPAEAIHVIEEGDTAFVSLDDWETTAEAVLEHFGSTPEWTRDLIHFAKTGHCRPRGSDALKQQ